MGITRSELFSRLGLVRVVEPVTAAAFANWERKVWADDLDSSPHGDAWHTGFHASAFPGDDPMACGRKAIYGLMNIPSAEPFDPKVKAMGEVGQAIEKMHVDRWAEDGRLLSATTDEDYQTGFTDPTVWLTGNTDAIILPPFWKRGHVVDVKSKDHDVVMDMLYGRRSFDEEHRKQILTYIALAHDFTPWSEARLCEETWALAVSTEAHPHGECPVHGVEECLAVVELAPPIDGTLYYVSRSRPRTTAEFYFSYDPAFAEAGREKLREWRYHFIEGILPARPKEWKWSQGPCQYCSAKRNCCKPDDKAGVAWLERSHAIPFAQTIRPAYDYQEIRQAVLDRWNHDG